MSLEKLTLQRFRFYDMDPGLIPSDVSECVPRFDLNLWKSKGRAVYWKGEGTGISYFKDGIEIAKECSVSSDTFFNAFFLTYWRKLTRLQKLSVLIKARGKFLLEVFRHTDIGESELLVSRKIEHDGEIELDFEPSMISSGLRLSYTLTSMQKGSRLLGGAWQTRDAPNPVCFGIIIATFGRNVMAERVIRRILDDSDIQKENIRIMVVDQNKVPELGHLNQDRCRVISQRNLGCAAALTRGIHESLSGENRFEPTHIMFIDDDVDLETDSILRSIRVMQLTKSPFIIGGIMLDLYRPNRALAHGENFSKNDDNFRWTRSNIPDADMAEYNGLDFFSIPSDYDYTGGWFCVFPSEIYSKIGYQMPFFIQGNEDLEYCVRARNQGYLTYTFPGIGIWHLPFYSKTEAGWKMLISYYHQLVHHSLYGYDECSSFFFQVGTWAMTALIKGKYRHAAAYVRALENFLEGWRYFSERTYPDYLQEIQEYLVSYDAKGQAPGVVKKDQLVDLRKRLDAVVARFEKEGKDIQTEFGEKLPSTFTMESWKYYLINGNLSSPPPPDGIK